ncbi:MAG: redox-sensitive transcriptional activator SoxR [Nocardioidaceae bacterium]|nr:redox-sensitive transcriptional activator SoxR [Nocardioidaceae bacterium]
MPAYLTIGELSRRSGVAASALRFYETVGLIEADRTSGNQRRYPRHMLRRIAFIRAAQRVGLSLDEVKMALSALPAGRTPTKADWARVAERWTVRIDRQIADLELLKSQLTGCVGCGCLSLRKCSLANPNDVVGRTQSGPAWLATQDPPSPFPQRAGLAESEGR